MAYATPNTGIETLAHMLTFCRPASSKTEKRFIREYIAPLGMQQDNAGNLYRRIGSAPVLWSCHTDTMHRKEGTQVVVCTDGMMTLPTGSPSSCLGADDTAGIWLMREMIQAGVEGLYIFHRAEERGGIGSSHIAKHNPKLLAGMFCAIALDRRGTNSVITHQGFGRCCSDAFADSLAAMLPRYKKDDSGVFTDTANYVHLIGECTNISIGYYSEHTEREALDTCHLLALRDALIRLDHAQLVYKRMPGEDDPADYSNDYWSRWYDDIDQLPRSYSCGGTVNDLERMVESNPHAIADLLEEYGFDRHSLQDEIMARGGMIRR